MTFPVFWYRFQIDTIPGTDLSPPSKQLSSEGPGWRSHSSNVITSSSPELHLLSPPCQRIITEARTSIPHGPTPEGSPHSNCCHNLCWHDDDNVIQYLVTTYTHLYEKSQTGVASIKDWCSRTTKPMLQIRWNLQFGSVINQCNQTCEC